jgi:hypothetical protein
LQFGDLGDAFGQPALALGLFRRFPAGIGVRLFQPETAFFGNQVRVGKGLEHGLCSHVPGGTTRAGGNAVRVEFRTLGCHNRRNVMPHVKSNGTNATPDKAWSSSACTPRNSRTRPTPHA